MSFNQDYIRKFITKSHTRYEATTHDALCDDTLRHDTLRADTSPYTVKLRLRLEKILLLSFSTKYGR